MKRLLAITLLTTLASCTERSIWYQQGVSLSQRDRDALACEVQATRDAPVATQGPMRLVPGGTSCRMETLGGLPRRETCITTAPRWESGPITTVDVNKPLRIKVYRQCMADLGYTQISLPRCETRPRTVPATMGPLTANSCAVPLDSGTAIAP